LAENTAEHELKITQIYICMPLLPYLVRSDIADDTRFIVP